MHQPATFHASHMYSGLVLHAGYHGDDGYAFSGSGQGRAYGPPYSTGDVIGALFNRVDRTIR